MQKVRFCGEKSAREPSGCFDGCSFPTFVHFAAIHCKSFAHRNAMYINRLCGLLRWPATTCKTSKNRLKIRRDNLSWGFDPPLPAPNNILKRCVMEVTVQRVANTACPMSCAITSGDLSARFMTRCAGSRTAPSAPCTAPWHSQFRATAEDRYHPPASPVEAAIDERLKRRVEKDNEAASWRCRSESPARLVPSCILPPLDSREERAYFS